MKRYIMIFAVLLFSVNAGTALAVEDKNKDEATKTATVKGQVVDKITGEPLAGVSIEVPGTEKAVYTDFEGRFVISAIPAGSHDLHISYLSYQREYHNNMQFKSSNDHEFKFKLQPIE